MQRVEVSQFALLMKSPDALRKLAGEQVNTAQVRARVSWLLEVEDASQLEFAHDLVHREPPVATFHATLAAILHEPLGTSRKRAAPSVPLLEVWLQLEEVACKRTLLMHSAALPALCKQYGIDLRRKASKNNFKFPHQEKFTECDRDELCQKLAKHGLARASSMQYDAEVSPAAQAEVGRLEAEARKRAK